MDIKSYVINEINKLDKGTISFQECFNELCIKLQTETGKTLSEDEINKLLSYLSKYQNKEITIDEFVSYFQNALEETIDTYPTSSGAVKPNSNSSSDEEVVDVDVDVVLDASNQYGDIENIISSSTIEVPSRVTPFVG